LRVVQGIGIGGEMPVAAAYISELSKARGRGRFFMLYEMIFPVGLMATSQIGAWVVPAWGWETMFLIGGIPGLIVTFLLLRLPESPRWLISRGRLTEAERIVEQIEGAGKMATVGAVCDRAATVNNRWPPALAERRESVTVGQPERGRWRDVIAPSYRHRTFVFWTLCAAAYFVTNSLNNWMPSLYNTGYHLGLKESLRAASLTN